MTRGVVTVLALCAFSAAGCVPRLSDPFFAFRDLHAPEAEPGQSLVFGTIQLESSLLGPGDVAAVVLKRVIPEQEEIQRVASKRLPFRAFRTRQVKDGHFVIALEPGAYELVRIVGDDWLATELAVDEDGRRAMRFTVTRPAVVDLGIVHLAPSAFGSYAMTLRTPPADPGREAVLRAAVSGTAWERLDTRGAYR